MISLKFLELSLPRFVIVSSSSFSSLPFKFNHYSRSINTIATSDSPITNIENASITNIENHNNGNKINSNNDSKVKFALIPRINPFKQAKQIWIRDFQTFNPINSIDLNANVFNVPTRIDILHRIVHWYRSLLRAGTACAKDRSMVRGSHRKIHPQKGTGKARAGSSRAPQRRGGGVVFPPIPGSWYYPLSPKVRLLGMKSALSTKLRQGELTCIDETTIKINQGKTKEMVQILENIKSKKILILDTEPINAYIERACRSIQIEGKKEPRIKFMNVIKDRINAYHLLNNNLLILTKRAIQYYENHLTRKMY